VVPPGALPGPAHLPAARRPCRRRTGHRGTGRASRAGRG
jgi:hypothetical protein